MSRYVSMRPRAGWVPCNDPDQGDMDKLGRDIRPLLPELTVPEARGPMSTGLYDAAGNELFRLPDPLGFHNPKD